MRQAAKEGLHALTFVSNCRNRKELLKPWTRLVTKISQGSPITIANDVVFRVMAYANQMEPIVEVVRQQTDLFYDVLSYSIVHNLGSLKRTKLKEDGMNVAEWLDALAGFTGASKYWYILSALACKMDCAEMHCVVTSRSASLEKWYVLCTCSMLSMLWPC